MPNHFKRLFNYDQWANNEVHTVLQNYSDFKTRSKCISYLAHIAGTQQVWYQRISPSKEKTPELWPDYTLRETDEKLAAHHKYWQQLIETNIGDIDTVISYSNSKGELYETPLSDIMMHLIIHGQHHRAQIAKVLRNANIKPPATDVIYFSRLQ